MLTYVIVNPLHLTRNIALNQSIKRFRLQAGIFPPTDHVGRQFVCLALTSHRQLCSVRANQHYILAVHWQHNTNNNVDRYQFYWSMMLLTFPKYQSSMFSLSKDITYDTIEKPWFTRTLKSPDYREQWGIQQRLEVHQQCEVMFRKCVHI